MGHGVHTPVGCILNPFRQDLQLDAGSRLDWLLHTVHCGTLLLLTQVRQLLGHAMQLIESMDITYWDWHAQLGADILGSMQPVQLAVLVPLLMQLMQLDGVQR